MAEFTMTLDEVLTITDDIGLNAYPIFDESYREALNQKIIDHFRTQEIGRETIELFRASVKRKMNEVMPYYNQLYKSERLTVDPFNTINLSTIASGNDTTQVTATASSDGTTKSDVDGKARAVVSNTPQSMLAGNGDYATGATDTTSENVSTSEAAEKSNQSHQGNQASESSTLVSGWQGSQADLLMRFRETFLNIDVMIIDELAPLFMLITSSNSNFTNNNWNYPGFGFPLYGRF